MKKIVVALCAVMMVTLAAQAEFVWSWWEGAPVETVDKDVTGCVLGFASRAKTVKGAQVSVFYSKADVLKSGCQYAIGYAQALEIHNGAQVAFITKAQRAALQFGLVCINDEGFLPVFIFFNFTKGPSCWGNVD